MKKQIVILFILTVMLSGCTQVKFSSSFKDVPIYPGSQLLFDNDTEDGKRTEIYIVPNFKGNFDDAIKTYTNKLDKNGWRVEESEKPVIAHGIDQIKGFVLKNEKKAMGLTIGLDNGKAGRNLTITLLGDKQ